MNSNYNLSVEEVKEVLQQDSFVNLQQDKMDKFIPLILNMNKEEVIKLIEETPNFYKLSEAIVNQLRNMCANSLEKNEESRKSAVEAYDKVLSELSFQIRSKDISEEKREQFIEKMIEVADKIATKDTENKVFINNISQIALKVGKVAAIVGICYLGKKCTKKG